MSDSHTTSEPAPKRVCTEDARDQLEIPIANASCKESILDRLHRDCMRMILDYLSTNDILHSMTVSKQWQDMILEYLRDAKFCLEYYHLPRTHFMPRLLGLVDCVDVYNRRTLPFKMCQGDAAQFQARLRGLGPGVASIILDRLDETCLKAIAQNCPNLNDLMLIGMQDSLIVREPQGRHGRIRPQKVLLRYEMLSFSEEVQQCLQQLQLKRISFIHSPKITEAYISEFLKTDSIEGLVICRNKSVDGHCLSHIQSPNLKTLRLVGCTLLSVNLTSIADRLARLTMLELSNNPVEILQNVHLVLAKTPNLEHLALNTYVKTNMGNEFVECLGRLGRLKRLSLCWNDNVSDAWLEAAAAGGLELHAVDIETGNPKLAGVAGSREVVTAGGVLALCRGARRSLAHLGLAGRPGLADSLAAFVGCPALQSLDLRGCPGVSPARVAAAAGQAGGRARPLRLHLARTQTNKSSLSAQLQKSDGLIFDFVDASNLFKLV